MVNYKESLQYLETFVDYERVSAPSYALRSFNLKRMERLLQFLGSPQDKLTAIHIAGTKGKGSTAIFLTSILQEAGFQTGLYSSPHLIDFRERIRIGRKLIARKRVSGLITRMKPAIEKFPGACSLPGSKTNLGCLTFFEIYTALAFLFFAEEEVDFAVLETGLGGRLDATNVLKALVCAITPISFDHTGILGKTLSSIARQKAGIIKEKGLVITSPQKDEALKVIREVCRKKKARLFEVGKDLRIRNRECTLEHSRFDLEGIFGSYKGLRISLLGEHQLTNAACAVGISELLRLYDVKISQGAIKRGLRKAEWPGRLEILQKKPLIVLDGAQNESSAQALRESIEKIFPYEKLILLLGISLDKDIRGIGKRLCPLAEEVIVTAVDNPRAASPFYLEKQLKVFAKKITPLSPARAAFEYARRRTASGDLLCAAGSLYLVGKVREIYKKL